MVDRSAETASRGGRRMLIVPEELMEKIDEARGELSRDQFLQLIMESAITESAVGDVEEEEVFCFVPASLAGGADIGEVAAEPRPAAAREARAGATEETTGIPLSWWGPAILLFGFGDTLTSGLVFARGGAELNPIMRLALSLPGGLWSFAFVKTVILAILVLLSQRAGSHLRWLVPLLTTAVGSYLVWHNLLVFLRFR